MLVMRLPVALVLTVAAVVPHAAPHFKRYVSAPEVAAVATRPAKDGAVLDPAANIRSTFTGLYSLADSEAGHAAAAKALASPAVYVMKPQREGGGNMLHGDEMCKALREMPVEERAGRFN
jgi:hypothetical protein